MKITVAATHIHCEWFEGGYCNIDLTVTPPVFPMTNEVKASYPNGICPDCVEDIPDDVDEGQVCCNCGHVFTKEVRRTHTKIDDALRGKKVAQVYTYNVDGCDCVSTIRFEDGTLLFLSIQQISGFHIVGDIGTDIVTGIEDAI